MNQKNKKWGILILAVLAIFLYGCSNGVITGNVIYDKTAPSDFKVAEANETPAAANSSQNEVQETVKNQTAAAKNQTKFNYNIITSSGGGKKTAAASSGGSSGRSSGSSTPSSNLPDAAEFSGDTTDFSQESDLTNVNNLVLEVPNSGKIDFSGQSVDVANADLDSYVQISNNLISVDSNHIPELNKPATLTLYGLSFSNPVILENGNKCTDCNIVSYSNGDLTFSVQHFTNYTANETGCAQVVDDLVVNSNAVLCSGTYNVNDANNDGIIKMGANGVVLNCNSTTIIGNGSGYGIYSNGYNGNTIKNCNLKKYKKGIYLENSDSSILMNNAVINSTIAGIELIDASHNTISGNTLRFNTKRGINLVPSAILNDATSCKYNIIKNNLVENQEYGITLQNGNDYNNVTNNIVNYNSNAGIQITGNNNNNAVHNYVSGNNLTGNGGLDVTESKRGFYSGIYIGNAGLNSVLNNNVLNNLGPGIALFNSSNNEIKNNNVKNNAFEGVLLMNDIVPSRGLGNNNNIISGNEITDNNGVAVVLGINSAGNKITENNLANSVIGNHFGMFKTNDMNYVFANNTFNGKDVVTVNGTIYETNGSKLAEVNISYYYTTVWDAENLTGNYSALLPKAVPDAVTDSNGYYEAYLPEGEYDMVMQHSKEIDFDINTNKTSKEKGGGKGHDAEVNKNSTDYTDFNIEGHIIHSGTFEHGNNYTCNEYVEFTMFGMNKGSEDGTFTFIIENHTDIGGPERSSMPCVVDGKTVYCGNQSNPSENLYLPADGNKYDKRYSFYIPCGWTAGRYDIHVYDNLKWGQMHKIGNFFVVEDITPPELEGTVEGTVSDANLYDTTSIAKGFTNDTFHFLYYSIDPEQPGTLAKVAKLFAITGRADDTINITVDKDITSDSNGDGITDNDVDYSGTGGETVVLPGVSEGSSNETIIVYNKSGHYTMKITSTDKSGRSITKYANVTVYITEEEARKIDDKSYGDYGVTIVHDQPCDISSTGGLISYFNFSCDSYSGAPDYVGNEYITYVSHLKNYSYIWGVNFTDKNKNDEPVYSGTSPSSATKNWFVESGASAALEQNILECTDMPFIKTILPSTYEEYNNTIYGYLQYMCDCGWLIC